MTNKELNECLHIAREAMETRAVGSQELLGKLVYHLTWNAWDDGPSAYPETQQMLKNIVQFNCRIEEIRPDGLRIIRTDIDREIAEAEKPIDQVLAEMEAQDVKEARETLRQSPNGKKVRHARQTLREYEELKAMEKEG